MIRYRGAFKRILLSPLVSIPLTIIVCLIFAAISLLPNQFGQYLVDIFSLPCLALLGVSSGQGIAEAGDRSLSHKRGTILRGISRTKIRNIAAGNRLTVAGLPVTPSDETKHFKMIGTTGTGKSTAIRELLTGALARGDRAVIADPDASHLRKFYRPTRGDVILNTFEPKAARWDLFAEMQTLYDADQLALSLIPDTEGTERPWRGYARVFLTALLRQLHRVKHNDVTELYRLLSITPIDDLRDLLADTAAGAYLTQDNGKFFSTVRAVANTHLASLEHIATQTSGTSVSVRNWVKNRGEGGVRQRGGVLFLPYRANEIAALRSIIST
jgi:hypothetical protein